MYKRKKYIILLIACLAIIVTTIIIVSTQLECRTSKTDIIADFHNNKNRFENIQSYTELLNDNIYIYLDGKKIVYEEGKNKNNAFDKVEKDIAFIMIRLKYIGIYGGEGDIKFVKKGSKNQTGIYYIKNDVKPEDTPSGGYYERITDNWFYYFENPT